MDLPRYTGPPVAVVGNGPVGQTTALLLARWGIPVILLDARDERNTLGSKAICQQRDVLDIWSAIGADQIAADGLTWTTARTFYREHELGQWSFADGGSSPLPPFVNISQSRTEELLDHQIRAQSLIDVRWGHDVVALDQSDVGVLVTCVSTGGESHLHASYVVAAAGAGGDRIRQMAGVDFRGHSYDDRFLICDIRCDLPGWKQERRFYFDPKWNPGRQVLIHPCPNSIFRIDWQVPDGFDLAAEVATGGLDTRIRQIIDDRPYDLVWKSVYRFHARCVDRMRVGRVLLAGDCAHIVAPFGARGLNSGVADAENAAWKLAFVLHGWASENLLDSYDAERMAAARENLAVTGATMRFLVPRNESERARRERLLRAAMATPGAEVEIESGRFAEPFWYVESPLTTANPDRAFTGRPARGHMPAAVPGTLVPDAPVTLTGSPAVSRVRQVVRDGLLVLTADGVDTARCEAVLNVVTAAPTRVLQLADIDSQGVLATALDARQGEAWLLRPDGHIAAIVTAASPEELGTAVRRAVGGVG